MNKERICKRHKIPQYEQSTGRWECKLCKKESSELYRLKNKDKVNENLRQYRRENPDKFKKYWINKKKNPLKLKEYERIRRVKDYLKIQARQITHRAIYTNKILKQSCAICGEIKVEAHHKDYSKPLEIVWLCRKCHHQWHRENSLQVNI